MKVEAVSLAMEHIIATGKGAFGPDGKFSINILGCFTTYRGEVAVEIYMENLECYGNFVECVVYLPPKDMANFRAGVRAWNERVEGIEQHYVLGVPQNA